MVCRCSKLEDGVRRRTRREREAGGKGLKRLLSKVRRKGSARAEARAES